MAAATAPSADAGGSSTTMTLQELVLKAELRASSVTEALTHYEAALEQLNNQIRALPAGSAAQGQQIQCFKDLLDKAESLKRLHQSNPSAAEYSWRQGQARRLAEQAVQADGQGHHSEALELYFKLLECLNRCHALEPAPACQAAIMARFQVYLERAEQLRNMQQARKPVNQRS